MNSKDIEKTEKIDLEQLISSFKVSNKETFKSYLKDIWNDLTQRNNEKHVSGISKITFSSYYNLPGIINDRLFNVIDSNKSGYLELGEFIIGMSTLFCEDFDVTSRFIFNFYDFDKDGEISKEDIRIVLSYVSLSQDIHNYKDRVNSQEELHSIIETCFVKIDGEKMEYQEFKRIIENKNSDIYLMILLFLYEKRPFTKATLLTYNKQSDNISPIQSPPHSPIKLVASPTKNSFSPYNFFKRERKRIGTFKENQSAISKNLLENSNIIVLKRDKERHSTHKENIISLIPTTPNVTIPKHSKFNSLNTFTNNQLIIEEKYSPIHRKNKKNLKNIGKNNFSKYYSQYLDESKYEKDVEIEPAFKQIKTKKKGNNKDNETGSIFSTELTDIKKKDQNDDNSNKDVKFLSDYDEEDNSDEEENEDNINEYEGYLIKFIDNRVRSIWFKLVGKDLFYFKNKNDEIHKGMHNLSGVFVSEEPMKEINGKKCFCFSVTYPKKTRMYYVEDENEYKTWVEKLKIATEYTNLTDLYDIKEKIGRGKFGLIKLGINKKTKKKVAIKIMSKKDMNNQDLELARTEIEILKICQHPNIITLYDIFENVNYFYIIMEYCEGGDLFSYLEDRHFRLPEQQVAKFMHKMCAAIYYIHSYGITHRDLKPENVLMTSKNDEADLRILDFGLSKIIGPDEKCTEPYGTLSYVAPEVLLDVPYGKEVDLWALGVITYLMLSGSLPFDDKHSEEAIAKKTVIEPPPYKGIIWKKISNEARDFVGKLLEKDPEKRMNIKEALEHEWFHKFENSNVVMARRSKKDYQSGEFELYSNTESNLKKDL